MKAIALLTGLWLLLATAATAADHEKKTYRATVDNDGVQRVELLGGGYYFEPYRIIVRVNVPVELVVRKESGVVPHNIVMKSPEAGLAFEESLTREPKTIKFTPQKVGSYQFYCSKKPPFLASHREKGMEGVLEVVE
jgi:plastocyanin domain-containing protein